MIESSDFQTLLLLFRRPGVLPALPTNTIRLIREIDQGDASLVDIEQIVASDPALMADILRLSNTGQFGGCPGGSLKNAIFLIGQRSIKALAVSSITNAMLRGRSDDLLFDARRYVRQSTFVGLLARYVAVRAEQSGKTLGCTPDEAFAAGMLDGFALALLARIAPKVYNRLFVWAKRQGTTLNAAFEELYGRPLSVLAAEATQAMGLPKLFVQFLDYAEQPWLCDELYTSICAVQYAYRISLNSDWRLEDWSVPTDVPFELSHEVGLSDEELALVVPTISAAVAGSIPNSFATLR